VEWNGDAGSFNQFVLLETVIKSNHMHISKLMMGCGGRKNFGSIHPYNHRVRSECIRPYLGVTDDADDDIYLHHRKHAHSTS